MLGEINPSQPRPLNLSLLSLSKCEGHAQTLAQRASHPCRFRARIETSVQSPAINAFFFARVHPLI